MNNATMYKYSPSGVNEMYAMLLKKEYKEILNIHMMELMVLNYAHHVRGNDTYILRRAVHNVELNNQMKQVSLFYISKTNLYSRPLAGSYRFANMVACKISEHPIMDGFEQDDDYCIRIKWD